MEKSIIIIGNQGLGKTTLLKEKLAEFDPESVCILDFHDFKTLHKRLVGFEVIAIDGVTPLQLEYIADFSKNWAQSFIVTSQIDMVKFPSTVLDNFEIIYLN